VSNIGATLKYGLSIVHYLAQLSRYLTLHNIMTLKRRSLKVIENGTIR